jgi:hypothetical protein
MEGPPTDRAIKAACKRCRRGELLSEISKVVGRSEEQVLGMLGQATNILPDDVAMILRMKESGDSLQEISVDLDIGIETLRQFLADDLTDSTNSQSSSGLQRLSTEERVRRTVSMRRRQLNTEDLRLTAPARLNTQGSIFPRLDDDVSPIGSQANIEENKQVIPPALQITSMPQVVFTAPPFALPPQFGLAAPPQVVSAYPPQVALAAPPPVAFTAPPHDASALPLFLHRPYPRIEREEQSLQTSETDAGQYPLSSVIYSYSYSDNVLFITDLNSHCTSSVIIRKGNLYYGSCWTELPDRSLLITGGAYGQVLSIQAPRFVVTRRAPMHFNRTTHASVYYDRYVYAVGGNSSDELPTVNLNDCERYLVSEDRWEDIPPIPEFCSYGTCIVEESTRSLYALGTPASEEQGIIQKLCLTSLNWTVLALRLPHQGGAIPVFKLTESAATIYFVMESCLYCFNPFFRTIQLVKALPTRLQVFFGPSYYRAGVLYSSNCTAAPFKTEIGLLS